MFLWETKLRSEQMQEECRNLKFENVFVIGKNGMNGKLALCWDVDVQLKIIFHLLKKKNYLSQ